MTTGADSNPGMSDRVKRYVLMFADAVVLPIALWAAVELRYGDLEHELSAFWFLFPVASVVGVLSCRKLDLDRAIVRYIGPSSILPVLQGVTLAAIAVSYRVHMFFNTFQKIFLFEVLN